MPSNLKSRLQQKEALHGIWRLIQSHQLTEIIGSVGFDFQIFDREHGSSGFRSLETAIRTCELAGSSPWVRVGGINSTEVQRSLDIGAQGIVFPQLKGVEDFQKAVQTMKFPPLGCRGYNPFTRAGNYGTATTVPKMLTDDFAACVPIIETLAAVDDLDKILQIPGIDLLYVGAYDLSVQLGCKGVMDDPRLLTTISRIIQQCVQGKMPTAVMVNSAEQAEAYRRLGVTVFVHTVDTNIACGAFDQVAKRFMKEL
jgi:4-hydroxy-2-oxoheptanedioate aldolase